MSKAQTKKENISKQLTSGSEVVFTLDSDPSSAKRYESDGKYGKQVSFSYFTKEGQIFFATETLHKKLLNYSKGDKITVSFNDRVWSVESDGVGGKNESTLERIVENTETTILLRKIALDLDWVKNKLAGNDSAKSATVEDDDLNF